MSDTQDAVVISDVYKESDEHVPDPTDQFGTLDTSGTAGTAHGQVDAVTPIFDVAKAQDRLAAKRALDPNDDGVDASLVVLPQGMVINESGEEAARERVLSADVEPVTVGGPNKYAEAASEEGDKAAEKAQASQQQEGAGSTQTSTDTARQTNKGTAKPTV